VDGSKKTAEPLPPVLVAGFKAYLEKGPEDAVRVWIKGSGIDDSKDALSQANSLRQVQDFYGSYRSFDVFKTRMVTSRVEAFYLVMNYDKGPLFAKFFFYKTEQGWVLVNFNFNTKEEARRIQAPSATLSILTDQNF